MTTPAATRWGSGTRTRGWLVAVAFGVIGAAAAFAQYPPAPQVLKDGTAVLLEDYASLPLSSLRLNGPYPAAIDYRGQLGKANALYSEPRDAPRAAARFFVPEQNGILYILDKSSRQFTPYVDVGRVFGRFSTDPNLGMGLVSLAFDPAYAKNGKFYTVHNENPAFKDPTEPSNASMPSLDLKAYSRMPTITPPAGESRFENVLIEWRDTNVTNDTFEGTAREVIRVGMSYSRHPMGDLQFNPAATPGHPDYGNLYIANGDAEAGERGGVTKTIPQRLDALQGKILRITPDVSLRPADLLAENKQYRVPSTGPDPNPFIAAKGARPEIFAYGFRNPHRITWDAPTNTLIASDIGNHSWEEVNIIVKGGNYGWADREGPEQHFVGGPNGGKTGSQLTPAAPLPSPDNLVVEGLETPATPVYPAAVFSHRDGLAVGSGFVYRGKLMPALVGKYLTTDIATGRLFYADLAEMVAAGGKPGRQAPMHELQVVYRISADATPVPKRMFDIVAETYLRKKGTPTSPCVLPDGSSGNGELRTCGSRGQGKDPYGVEYGGGRADVRLAVDGDGEIYAMSKADGMIRKLVSVVTPPPETRKTARSQ